MKLSRGSSKRSRSSRSSRLIELNNQRLQTAGRPGTKKFMDPNKVFIGNLPYDANEDDIYALFSNHWNVPLDSVENRIESIKIIRDWKTGQSKGYGFIQFFEPMVATSAMESINKGQGERWNIKGRRIRLDQGKRKDNDVDMREEQKKKSEVVFNEEELVILSALEDVAGGNVSVAEDDLDNGLGMSEDDMITFLENGGLQGIMPLTEETAGFFGIEGLYNDDENAHFEEYHYANDCDDVNIAAIDQDEDGEEIVYDGVFEEIYNSNEYEGLDREEENKRNRNQRRAVEKRRKTRKLPFKGFGLPN